MSFTLPWHRQSYQEKHSEFWNFQLIEPQRAGFWNNQSYSASLGLSSLSKPTIKGVAEQHADDTFSLAGTLLKSSISRQRLTFVCRFRGSNKRLCKTGSSSVTTSVSFLWSSEKHLEISRNQKLSANFLVKALFLHWDHAMPSVVKDGKDRNEL